MNWNRPSIRTRRRRPSIALATALMIAAAAGATPAAHAEPLGRLFFSPADRAALEKQRQMNLHQSRAIESGALTLNGIVQRSSGRRTVWINGVPRHDGELGTSIGLDPARPGQARLHDGSSGTASLKVGESFSPPEANNDEPARIGTARGAITPPAPNRKP